MRLQRLLIACLTSIGLVSVGAEVKPIRALLITGGCCHDYTHQKTALTEGISARANVVWSIVHEGDGTTDHRVSVYQDPDWAKNYDVVVHDECFADVKDAEFVRGILKPHRNGLPAVNLHCAMHCYRVDFDNFKEWFEFTGIDSRAHGAQLPISLSATNKHPILKGFNEWTTVNEELYNCLETWKTVTPLIYGKQGNDNYMAAWVNNYRGTRVFSTTLGHNTATVADPRYLDLVTRGLLWSVDKLNPDYLKPAAKNKRAQKIVRVPVNLASKKKATASGTQDGHPAEHATDGDSDTRWCAPDNGNNYWWQVDLGKPEEIVGVRIEWEKESAAYEYVLSGSADGKTWNTLLEQKKGPRPQSDELNFSAKDVRFVRITVTQAPSGSWASFFEFEVLGKETVEKPASSFSSQMPGVQSPAGFEQSLFAAPPNISYPVCLEATPWGDVFVGMDLNGSLDREPGRGSVVRCRDLTGDGVADKFKTFAQMDSPRGIVFDNNTLYVMHPPVLEAFHDDNGDGVSDRSEILVRGLGNDLNFRGADHTCNGVRMGIDGWLYIALGDYGALNAVAKDGSHVQVHGGGIVRVRPDGSRLEVFATGTRNTYDVASDPFMNLFTCDNTNDGDGWNLRLSHMIATGDYGYPSLFKNFADETMPTMRDFGGGSPTGALFLDEPGFPDEFGHGLYTCQWGWNNVTRHPLKAHGATFEADKETFIRIPRPTGIAADGSGNLYVASWKGATFNYAGQNVGFIARFAPLGNDPTPFPNLHQLSDKQLVTLLSSSSAVRRLHVQRGIIRRKPARRTIAMLAELASDSPSPTTQAAAVFTLAQINDAAAQDRLLKLSHKPAIREFVLRVLGESPDRSKVPTKLFIEALADKNPRVRLQAIVALNRLHRVESGKTIFPFINDSDPAIAHAAFRALVAFRPVDECLKLASSSDAVLSKAALRILGNLHEEAAVEGLIKELSEGGNKLNVLETLCRLYHREADWDGSWWTTRPDTSGPYYKPVTWDQTDKIIKALSQELARNDATTTKSLLLLLQKYKITEPAFPVTALESLVADVSLDDSLRRKAFQTIVGASEKTAWNLLHKSSSTDKVVTTLRDEFVRDPVRAKSAEFYLEKARAGTDREQEAAFAILLLAARNLNAPATVQAAVQNAISAENSIPLQRARKWIFPEEKTAASNKNAIAHLAFEEIVKRVLGSHGNATIGAKVFESAQCIKCHTVAKTDAPKGPFLGDITARYSNEELLESILRPSAKIAQGFETTTIDRNNEETLDGFIVRESGDEIELRNIAGATVVPKKSITKRGTRTTSIMPDGLADSLTVEDLASLLQYLKSMQPK